MKKKILALCLVVVLAVTTVTGITLAYFTDTDNAQNTFTVGNVSIDLTEPNWDAAGSVDAPQVYPGEALAKDPTVTNDGANPCFVRIQVTGWDCLAPADNITYRTDYVANKLGDNWVDGGDGYFYYTKVLNVGETTDALFDQIVMPTNLTNGYDGSYTLDVIAEAVQAQGIRPNWSTNEVNGEGVADMGADDLEEIRGWFDTCMG